MCCSGAALLQIPCTLLQSQCCNSPARCSGAALLQLSHALLQSPHCCSSPMHCCSSPMHCSRAALLQLSHASHHAWKPDKVPASFLFLFVEQDIVSIRKTRARSGNQHQGLGGHHHKQEEFQCHISPPSKACLESPLHTGSLRRQLPCTSCKIDSL